DGRPDLRRDRGRLARFADPAVIAAFAVAVLALAGFVRAQQVVAHPMMPLQLFRSSTVVITVAQRVRVHDRLLRAAVRDQPVPAAAPRPDRPADRRRVPADDAHRPGADTVLSPPRR